MASAPRGTGPPVAIGVAVPVCTGSVGAVPQAMSRRSARRGAASLHRRREIGGAHSKAIDIRAVEGWHVDGRHDIIRQRQTERVGQHRSSPGVARETARPRNEPAPPRATGSSGTDPARRPGGRQVELVMFDAHQKSRSKGANRRAVSISFTGAGHDQPGIRQCIGSSERSPTASGIQVALFLLYQYDLDKSDRGRDFARQRQDVVRRGHMPDRWSSTG